MIDGFEHYEQPVTCKEDKYFWASLDRDSITS